MHIVALLFWACTLQTTPHDADLIRLRYATPSRVLAAVAPAPAAASTHAPLQGIEYAAANDAAGTIAVRGTNGAVQAFRSLVAEMDVPPVMATLHVTVSRVELSGNAVRSRRTVADGLYRVASGKDVLLAGGDGVATFELRLVTTVVGATGVSLDGGFTVVGPNGVSDASRGLRRVPFGKRSSILETSTALDPSSRPGQRVTYVAEAVARREVVAAR